jgi:hypothetical protein
MPPTTGQQWVGFSPIHWATAREYGVPGVMAQIWMYGYSPYNRNSEAVMRSHPLARTAIATFSTLSVVSELSENIENW